MKSAILHIHRLIYSFNCRSQSRYRHKVLKPKYMMAAEESYPELLFVCIFWLLHAIFSLTEYIMAFCYILSSKWRSVFSRDLEAVDIEAVNNISKLPKHIAFLVLENDILYDDVAKLVIWSLLVGINVISLYDVHGKMKRNQGKLLGAINKEYIKYLGTTKI